MNNFLTEKGSELEISYAEAGSKFLYRIIDLDERLKLYL